jgi:hypothetical protein
MAANDVFAMLSDFSLLQYIGGAARIGAVRGPFCRLDESGRVFSESTGKRDTCD